jgi:hypothetical protein
VHIDGVATEDRLGDNGLQPPSRLVLLALRVRQRARLVQFLHGANNAIAFLVALRVIDCVYIQVAWRAKK